MDIQSVKLKILNSRDDDNDIIVPSNFTSIQSELMAVMPSADKALNLLLSMLDVVKQGKKTDSVLRYAWVFKPSALSYNESIHLVNNTNLELTICEEEVKEVKSFAFIHSNTIYLLPELWNKSCQIELSTNPIMLCKSCKFIQFKLIELVMKSFSQESI